ncbi:MAG: TldD/PmbA family protein [Asgard group archaeon]|nr:TldD/PmbA family protein [Asgard group archaeon]
MFNQALDIAQDVIKKCSKKMDEIEIYFSYNNEKVVKISEQSIGTQNAGEELGAGVRVIHKGSEGFTYTNIITKEALLESAENAFKVAKLSPKIEGLGIPTKKPVKELKGIYNKEIEKLTTAEITQDALDFIAGFTDVDKRCQSMLSSISADINGVAIINSNDILLESKSTVYQGGFALAASDEKKAGGFVFDYFFSRKHDQNLNDFGKKLGKRAVDSINQELVKNIEGSVIFKENAMFNPVGIIIALAASGDWQQRGRSFWKDRLADTVADTKLTVLDKPYDLKGGAGIKSFDAEGNPTKQLEIVKDGVLQLFLHNQRTANKENLESTGNAARGLGGGGPSYTNKPTGTFPNSPWILAGDMSEEELIADTKKGIIIESYTGTLRQTNGIFSGVVKGAKLIENGEIIKPITGVSIAGNVFELLNNISGIGKEYHLANAYLTTPYVRFEGIKFSTQ